MRVLIAAACLAATTSLAFAHGDAMWIQLGSYRGADGVHCCGKQDCFRVPRESAQAGPNGYVVNWRGRDYTIPYQQALVSENDDFWVCEKGDQTPRCFFAPPMGA